MKPKTLGPASHATAALRVAVLVAPGSATDPCPAAPKADVFDDYHGTRVPDPYRPLEDPDAPETRAWVEAENKVTAAFLETIPDRESIRKRLTELWNYEKFGVPQEEGGRYFYTRNS